MGKLIIINGSPRGRRSNSCLYAEAVAGVWREGHVEYFVTQHAPEACIDALQGCSDALLAFPLYTDGLPSGLLELLYRLMQVDIQPELRLHVLVNCGFKEPAQCAVAVDMVRLFCMRAGCEFGASISIGCGEAFPGTPLMRMAQRKLRRFGRVVSRGGTPQWMLSMPLTRGMYIRAADDFWLKRAKGLTRTQLEARRDEPNDKAQG